MSKGKSYDCDDHSSLDYYDSLFGPSTPEPVLEAPKTLSFQEVWRAIMTNPLSRMWAFNMKPPTADELLLSQELNPFEKSYDIKAQDAEDLFGRKTWFTYQYYEVSVVCHALSDGTYLGFGLHSNFIDVMAAPFAGLNPEFVDNSLIVNRFLLLCIEDRMAVVEFCWLTSGALTIRYAPYNSLAAMNKRDIRIYHSVYAFTPTDAQLLTACALVSADTVGAQDTDFVNAIFDNILFSDFYLATLIDTRFQEACIFCESKGLNICGCPMPMRRRTGDRCNEVVPHIIPSGKTAWSEFPLCKSLCAKKGTVIFNLKIRPHSTREVVAFSGLFPFKMEVKTNIKANPTLQQHMRINGFVNPLMTNIYNPGQRRNRGDLQPALIRGHGNINSNSISDLVKFKRTTEKRLRQIENMTTPYDENSDIINSITQHIRIEEMGIASIQNSQVIIQEIGNAPQTTVSRNLTEMSYEYHGMRGPRPLQSDTLTVSLPGRDVSGMNNGSNTSRTSGTGWGTTSSAKRITKSWDCPECGLTIHNNKSNFNRHIEAIHRNKNKSRFACDERCKDGTLCTATFQTAYNLKRHRRNIHFCNSTKIQSSEKGAAGAYAVSGPSASSECSNTH